MNKTLRNILLGIGILAVTGTTLIFIKSKRKRETIAKLGEEFPELKEELDKGNSPTPSTTKFNPEPYAVIVHDNLLGWTTSSDEETIVDTLIILTKEQVSQVRNYFNSKWGADDKFDEWLKDDLSDSNYNKIKQLL